MAGDGDRSSGDGSDASSTLPSALAQISSAYASDSDTVDESDSGQPVVMETNRTAAAAATVAAQTIVQDWATIRSIKRKLKQGATSLTIYIDNPHMHAHYIYLSAMQSVTSLHFKSAFLPRRVISSIRQMTHLVRLDLVAVRDFGLDALRMLCSKPHAMQALSIVHLPAGTTLTTDHVNALANLPALSHIEPFQITRGGLASMRNGRFPCVTQLYVCLARDANESTTKQSKLFVSDFDGIDLSKLTTLELTNMDLRGEQGVRFCNERLAAVRDLTLTNCHLPDLGKVDSVALQFICDCIGNEARARCHELNKSTPHCIAWGVAPHLRSRH